MIQISDDYIILLAAKLNMNPRECGLSSKDCKSILSKLSKLDSDILNTQANLNKLASLNKWDAYLKVFENEIKLYDKIQELIANSKNNWYNTRQLRLFV